jgi:hypothetical protein
MAQATKPMSKIEREKRNPKVRDWYRRERKIGPNSPSFVPKGVRNVSDSNDSK